MRTMIIGPSSEEAAEYLEEAIATFYSDCLLATCVMVGVAAEIDFLKLVDVGVGHPVLSSVFSHVRAERHLRQKITKFQNILPSLPSEIRKQAGEDLEFTLMAFNLYCVSQEVARDMRFRPERPFGSKSMFICNYSHPSSDILPAYGRALPERDTDPHCSSGEYGENPWGGALRTRKPWQAMSAGGRE